MMNCGIIARYEIATLTWTLAKVSVITLNIAIVVGVLGIATAQTDCDS
jgi:hypothetical protein